MKLQGIDYLYIAAGLAMLYVVWRAVSAGESVTDAARRFVAGINFDPSSLGPGVTLTPGAKMSEEEFIKVGYLVRLADGSTRITPAGQAYIDRQQALAGMTP